MNARSLAITRAVAVIGGTGALIAAATFAAATSNPVTISGISLASSDVNVLQVFDFGGGSFTGDTSNPSVQGQNINLDLTTTDSAKQPFYLQNTGNVTLNISATANPTASGSLDPNNVDVTFWDDSNPGPHPLGTETLAQLQAGVSLPLNQLAAGAHGDSGNQNNNQPGNYYVSFKLVNQATSFDTLSSVQLIFTGTPNP